MPSVIPGYEYDIFISYRHNDNRSGWVTEFVRALQEELAATIKEPVTVYFDSNPYDGLLETHNVDKSLREKLKCLIFVPILSQTYSDTKCFAWQHEFCVFNKLAQSDKYDRDIKLSSGNVGSRLLPVKIHDLEAEDIAIIENEIGGVLRAVDFIYKEPGVNRPLKSSDHRNDNQNKTDYRNQVNKVANAVKEILNGILKPTTSNQVSSPVFMETSDTRESIAVLPFRNMSHDAGQEYFSDGITENIIIELAGNKQLRTISRTSVMQYKNTNKSAPEIAHDLGVNFILEGGVQMQQNKVRINVQLIDAVKDDHVWSKVFNENMDDIFAIQSQVAETVAKELQASFNTTSNPSKPEVPTKNMEAYNLFLKGRHAFNQWGLEGYRTATKYFKQALAKDPDFQQAYSYLASCYSARMSWNGDLSPAEAKKYIDEYLEEAWKRGPQANDYITKAFVEFFIEKDFAAAETLLLKASELNPNNANALYAYSYVLNMMGKFDLASKQVDAARKIDPLTAGYFNYHALSMYFQKQYDQALSVLREGMQMFPGVLRFYDFMGRIFLTQGSHQEAIDILQHGLQSSEMRPPSMLAYLSAAYAACNEPEKSKALVDELITRSKAGEKGVNIYLVYAYHGQNNSAEASHWLNKAKQTNDVDLIWLGVDPILKGLDMDVAPGSMLDFKAVEKKIRSFLQNNMPNHPYHNLGHIEDVLDSAMAIAKHEGLTDEETQLLRLGALLHDVGFVDSPKIHEERGAAIAREQLPPLGFSEEQVEIICKMILATKLPQTPASKLEKVLCDADLDYLGRDDFYEIGRGLFEEFRNQGIVESEREWNLVQKTFLETHRYHTNYSKANREAEKQARLKEIIEKLRK